MGASGSNRALASGLRFISLSVERERVRQAKVCPTLDCSDLAVITARLRAPQRFLAASGRAARIFWGAAMPGRRRRLLSRRFRLIIFLLRPLAVIALLSRSSINVPIVSGLCHPITPFNQDCGNYNPRYRVARATRRDYGGNATEPSRCPSVS